MFLYQPPKPLVPAPTDEREWEWVIKWASSYIYNDEINDVRFVLCIFIYSTSSLKLIDMLLHSYISWVSWYKQNIVLIKIMLKITKHINDTFCEIEHESDLGSITFKCNRLHYNYFAIFMITLHYDYINFQM
jgi:hypothetical protein